ncbi:filamentous hemagglutinin N-terminal domain-containing protein [Pseudomonas sp.]|uniref:two-partner secretion domain-containing protein n=1 Tax=Pseudomonas sp. TaxID=306 RepID=UPI003CC604EC
MNQRPTRFILNPLRWAVATALLTHSLPSLAEGIVALPGPGGQAALDRRQGVPALNVVMPNDQGVSENHFSHYNVDAPGLVINNSLAPGQAQLGPAMEANPHFQGRAASTILMNVSGASPSHIQGPQEIFGQRADYLLANPNGILLNGASFINANRASFLVGIAELEDGRIVRLSASHEQALLQVGQDGASNLDGALELVTPTLDAQGALTARDELNVVLGHNTLDARDRSLLHTAAATATAIDAHLLGAMRAGRIRIVSTTEGAGVKMPQAQLLGRDGCTSRPVAMCT